MARPLRWLTLTALLLLLLGGAAPNVCWYQTAGPYHGWTGLTTTATGRFRVEQVDGVWWLVTPDGLGFFSAGVNHVSSTADFAPALGTHPYGDNVMARWGSAEAWAEEVIRRLELAGLNTVGAWSHNQHFRGRFPYTRILGFSGRAPAVPDSGGGFAAALRDFFDPGFETGAAEHAEQARPCAEDPFCIGVYTDNELPWGPGLRQLEYYADAYLTLPAGAPGKLALQAFFEERYGGDVAAFAAAWDVDVTSFDELQALDAPGAGASAAAQADRLAFRGRVAERYFRVVHDALRAVDPELLILGSRFLAYSTGEAVARAAAPYVDVFTVNNYEYSDGWFAVTQGLASLYGHFEIDAFFGDLDQLHRVTDKPVLITEFGYRAADVGLPNSHPPVYPVLPDQTARADAYQRYLGLVLERPYLVGAHWFEYADQPATGRFDGEDNNWGFVDIQDDPYIELIVRMWRVHMEMYAQRAALATD